MKKNWTFDSLLRKCRSSLRTFLIAAVLIAVPPPQSNAAGAQPVTVTLKIENVTLREALAQLEKTTGYTFLCKSELLDRSGRISIKAADREFDRVMSELLHPLNLAFRIDDNVVVITKQGDDPKKVILRGTVRDSDGRPLASATVLLKGTKTGMLTDANGQFTITTPDRENLILEISFVGMKTKEVRCRDGEQIDVVLDQHVSGIDEVVVTGYQTINRKDMVGSYSIVKAEDIMMPAYNSIDQMLQGQVAGMIVTNSSSRVGTSPQIQIRGTSTFLGNRSPLWVVDGIIQEDPIELDANSYMINDLKEIIGSQVSWLNPMDIETVTVLKDASATAVYGSKASNGVIVITTKKGQEGRPSINYTGNMSVNTQPNYGMFNLMNSLERVQFSQEAFNAGAFYKYEPLKLPYTYEGVLKMYMANELSYDEFVDRKNYLATLNTDWLGILTQTAISQNHNLSITGGNEKISYNVSARYSDSKGQEIGNQSKKMTGRVSLNVRLHEKVRLSAAMSGSKTINEAFVREVNPMGYALGMSRAIPAYDEEGEPLFYARPAGYEYRAINTLSYNFENERDQSGSRTESSFFMANMTLNWDLLDWLKYEFVGGYTVNNVNSESWYLEQTYYIAQMYRGYDFGTADPGSDVFKAAMLPFGGELFTSDAIQNSYNVQNKLLVSKNFENSRLNIMLGSEVRSNSVKNNSNTVWGYVPGRGEMIVRPPSPEDVQTQKGDYSGWGILTDLYNGRWRRDKKTDNYVSFIATAAYSMKDRYVINFSIRNDVSNRFGQDANKRFDPTYSFGVSWRVTEEPWMRRASEWITSLNFRATYGIQGNAMTRMGPDMILYQGEVAKIYNQYVSYIYDLPNPGLSWERTKTWNLGADIGFFNAFNLVVDYYWSKSNAVVVQDLAYEYGKTTMKLNGGIIINSGGEATIIFTPVNRKDFGISVSLNSSKNWNRTGAEQYKAKKTDLLNGLNDRVLKEGYPVSGFWSYSFAGLSAEDGRPLFNYIDVAPEDRDSNIDPTTFLVYSGESEPNFTGGINLGLRWKKLTLSSSFALLLGGNKRLPSPYANFPSGVYIPREFDNLSKDLNNRWKKPGDELTTIIPGLVTTPSYTLMLPDNTSVNWMEMWAMSDVMVVDASFLRCRQVSLTWSLNEKLCRRIGFKNLKFTAAVSNLFVIANKRFNGFDPELGTSVMPKNYSFGINIGL